MEGKFISIYEKNHVNKQDERLGLFQNLKKEYLIKKALYPGSYAHITPAFVFPTVIFNDVYKKLLEFYDSDEVFKYINKTKEYPGEPFYSYIHGDYYKKLSIEEESFDLLISQYAGFVSRACRRYLKVKGILVVNNSHGDASMASLSPCYEFIAVINKRGKKYTHSTRNLDQYFIPKKKNEITEAYLEKHRHGVGYTKTATDYIFKRTS
ncbi:MAG: class I SAM-dependent methyltransferase [Promethearchaeota archaeon]|nr:MAG: class I SAM-dependent methyltransferase [Candidatus Lokiarchaeota archaeon]